MRQPDRGGHRRHHRGAYRRPEARARRAGLNHRRGAVRGRGPLGRHPEDERAVAAAGLGRLAGPPPSDAGGRRRADRGDGPRPGRPGLRHAAGLRPGDGGEDRHQRRHGRGEGRADAGHNSGGQGPVPGRLPGRQVAADVHQPPRADAGGQRTHRQGARYQRPLGSGPRPRQRGEHHHRQGLLPVPPQPWLLVPRADGHGHHRNHPQVHPLHSREPGYEPLAALPRRPGLRRGGRAPSASSSPTASWMSRTRGTRRRRASSRRWRTGAPSAPGGSDRATAPSV